MDCAEFDPLTRPAMVAATAAARSVSVLVVDTALRYRSVLGGAVLSHGYTEATLVGRGVADVVPAPAFARIGELFRRALGGEAVVDVAESIDATAVYETTYAPVEENGAVTGAVAVIRDVTAEHRALADLRAGEELQRTVLDAISDVVALTSGGGRIVWVSPSALAVLGRRPEDLVGRSVFDFVHPDDRNRVLMRRGDVLAGRGPVEVTYRFRRGGGDWTWVESHARAIPGDGVARVVVTLHDVSERQRLEAERTQALEMFELSFAAAPIGKALVAPDGRFLKVNAALGDLLHRSEAELLAATFQEITHPDDLATDEDLLAETAAGAREGYRIEKRYLRPDGEVVWALLAVSVVRAGDGAPRFFISQVEDITDRKTALRKLERHATTDALTELPNRLLLMDRLRHALALARHGGGLVGVVFLDLDRFAAVNDALGHDAGDELLRQVALRLARTARECDTTTCLGGDEFVIVCEQVESLDAVAQIGERLRSAVGEPFTVYGHDVRVSASIGVTAGRTGTAEALLREADRARYAAKHAGRRGGAGRVDVYGEALEALAHDQLALQADLHDGIARGELVVHYQPIVSLRTGAVVAREALVRWQHPALGLLYPATFLGGLDRTRLGVALGEDVLTRACAAAAGWSDDVVVHVNISARHLAQPRFPRFVADCLQRSGLAPDRLVLEITEGLVLAAAPSTLTAATALTDLGVGLSLDDFGTGYASIAALSRAPIDSFKIDRSFVADAGHHPASAALVEGLIGLGAHLDLDVIAEGVETAEQAEWLAERGCPHAQGYHFGAPAPHG